MRIFCIFMMFAATGVFAQEGLENLAFEKPVTVTGWCCENNMEPSMLTDGITVSDPYLGGPEEVQIDFEDTVRINIIKIWHYWADGRSYHENKVALSLEPDFKGEEIVVFDSEVDGEYPETAEGKTLTFDVVEAGYLHAWVNGSTANEWHHWVEIQAFFDPSLLSVDPSGKLPIVWGKLKKR